MEALSRNTDPSTSHEAAQQMKAKALRTRMLQLIRGSPDGLIWDDLRVAFPGVKETSISPRVKELERLALIRRDGEKRLGISGVRQLVCRPAINSLNDKLTAMHAL